MKNLKKIKIGILLILNTYFICLWIQESLSTNFVGKEWINLIFPSLILVFSIVVLVVFMIIEFLLKNQKANEIPKHANKKIIITVLIHALLTGITLLAICFIMGASTSYLGNMLRPRLFNFPLLVFFCNSYFFIKSYFFALFSLYVVILFLDYLLCHYLMKRIGERFIAWSYLSVAFVLIILMSLVMFSLGDYLNYHLKEIKQVDEYWSKNQVRLWLRQNSLKFEFKELTIKEVFLLLNKETSPSLKIKLHAPEKIQAIKISYKPNVGDSYVMLDFALEVIKTKIEKLTGMNVYWNFKGNQIDFYCIEKSE